MPSINLISSSFHANPAFFPWKGPPSRPVQSIHGDFDVAPPKRKHTTRKVGISRFGVKTRNGGRRKRIRCFVNWWASMERRIGRLWPNLFQDVAANKSSLCRCCECSVVSVGAIIWIHLSRRDPGLPEEDAILLSLQRKMGNRWS